MNPATAAIVLLVVVSCSFLVYEQVMIFWSLWRNRRGRRIWK